MSLVHTDLNGGQGAPDRTIFRKLRPGPGRSADEVTANQFARLCGAMVELTAERGYEQVTVRSVSRTAGVSTKTFYKCFANLEECFVATYSRIVHDALRSAFDVGRSDPVWVHACTRALFEGLGRDPKVAHLVLVEVWAAGPAVGQAVSAASRAAERLVSDGFATPPGPVRVPPQVVRGIVGAALLVARTRLLGGTRVEPAVLADGFAEWLLALRGEHLENLGRRLPRGNPFGDRPARGRLPVADDRGFLLDAVSRLSGAQGYESLSIPAICREAGVTRRTFDAHFSTVEDCFLAAVRARIDYAVEDGEAVASEAPDWQRGTVRMATRLCTQLARDPELARLGFLDVAAPGRAGLALRDAIVSQWSERLLRLAPGTGGHDAIMAEASLAAAWCMARSEVAAGRAKQASALAPLMAFIILAPAAGADAAEAAIAAELGGGSPGAGVRRHLTQPA